MDQNGQYPYPYPCQAQRTPYPHSSVNTYSSGHCQGVRAAVPQASVGLDLNRDGRADHILTGVDYNRDGIPDVLQQGYTHPAAAEYEEEPLRVSMIVPEGAMPGTKLQYSAPDGQELRLTVPEGVPPGSVMTLTQDPVTKAWKCMAEPAEQPAAPTYEPPPQHYASTVKNYQSSAPTATTERITKYVAGAAPVVTYQASSAPRIIGTTMPTMPVNLSYVPPPVMPASVTMPSSSVQYAAPAGATYTSAAYTTGSASYAYSPPRQETTYTGATIIYDQRPSYTPPPVMPEQRPSYTPPPVTLMESRPSYTPLPQVTLMESRPSYTPLPQVLPAMQGPPLVLDSSLMATTTKVSSMVVPSGMSMLAQGPSITTLPSHQPPPVMPQQYQSPVAAAQPPMGMPPSMAAYGQPMGQQMGQPMGQQMGQQMGPQLGGLGPQGAMMGIGMPPLGLQPPMGLPPVGQQQSQPWGPMGGGMMGGLQPPAPLLGGGFGLFGQMPGQMPGQMHGQMPGQLPGQMPGPMPGQMPGHMQGHMQGQMPGQMQPGQLQQGYGMYQPGPHGYEAGPQMGHQQMMGPPQQ